MSSLGGNVNEPFRLKNEKKIGTHVLYNTFNQENLFKFCYNCQKNSCLRVNLIHFEDKMVNLFFF